MWSKGDMCFRSGDILVSDCQGYLYFKVTPPVTPTVTPTVTPLVTLLLTPLPLLPGQEGGHLQVEGGERQHH